MMINSVLFVCLGNICRSPTAEAIFREKARRRGLSVIADSAGTAGWHLGKAPYEPMQTTAAEFGYDLSPLRARQVVQKDFSNFDLIIAMDQQNLLYLKTLTLRANTAHLRLMGAYISAGSPPDIPDPYYTRDFVGALKIIEQAIDNMLSAQWPK